MQWQSYLCGLTREYHYSYCNYNNNKDDDNDDEDGRKNSLH